MSQVRGGQTYNEICSQFDSWHKNLRLLTQISVNIKDFWNHRSFNNIILTGCGTSYYIALAGGFLLADMLKTRAIALPASELYFFPHVYSDKNSLLIALSRSGATTEVLRAVEMCKHTGLGAVLAITCREDSPLTTLADYSLVAVEAEDKSVVQTRSFTTMYVMLLTLASIIGEHWNYLEQLDSLPDVAKKRVTEAEALLQNLANSQELHTFIFLGSGHNYGLACGAMLNLKEMSLSHTEAYHFLELRHGPLSIVNPNTLVVGFVSEKTKEHEVAVLKDVALTGARIMTLSASPIDEAHFSFTIQNLSDYVRSIAFFPMLHLLSFYKAISNGVDPDSPPHLRRVVVLQPKEG